LERLEAFSGEIQIPESWLHGTLEVTPILVAAGDSELEFAGINKEYSSSTFQVQEGDLLAHGPTEALEADHQASSTDQESWIKFSLSSALGADEYEISPANDVIIVYTGTNVQQVVGRMSSEGNMQPYLFMSIYKDVFVEAIATILDRYKNQEDADETWAKGLTHYIDSKGMSLAEIRDDDRNSILRFVQRMIAADSVAAIAKRIREGKPLS
jgi:hypothetical protein